MPFSILLSFSEVFIFLWWKFLFFFSYTVTEICESWTVKKAECQRIDAFELWCWRRLLRVPWTARRSNQSILKEISPGCSLEGMMLKLKLQYFGHLKWSVDSLEKTDAGRDWGQEEKGMTEDEMAGWHHWLNGRESEWTPGVGYGQGGLACCDSWVTKSQTQLSNWTELNWTELNKGVVVPHCCFNFQFPIDTWYQAFFPVLSCHLHIFFGEVFI